MAFPRIRLGPDVHAEKVACPLLLSGRAVKKRNFSTSDYFGIPMIRPGPDVHAEKVACPLFFLEYVTLH
jgi:hypothetical protein